MKTCNSRRVIYHDHDHQGGCDQRHQHPHHQQQQIIISDNVPNRLGDEELETTSASSLSSSQFKRQRRCGGSNNGRILRDNENNSYIHTKSFSFNVPKLLQGFVVFLIFCSALHVSQGSHLPSSYLVQKENSNSSNEIKFTVTKNSAEDVTSTKAESENGGTTTSIPSTTVEPDSSTSATTIITPDVEPRPASGAESEAFVPSSLNEASTTTHSPDSSSTTPEASSSTSAPTMEKQGPTTSKPSLYSPHSEEESNDSNLNLISEHDHYDEYAILKAALDMERSTEDSRPASEGIVRERRPYLLQAADGRKYASIEAICDDRHMTISGVFDDIFKGRIYALGYSDEAECGASNAKEPQNNITFSLPLGSCGVQMLALDDNLENDLRHEVTLYIQYSAFLQQVVDEKISVSCTEMKKTPAEETSNEELLTSNRQGRRMGNIGDTGKFGSTKISTRIGESWMEILAGKDPSPKSRKMSPVSVGEDVTLVISTKVLRGFDARIVNCSAHDGSRTGTIDGSRSQQILDSAGCSLDKSLVPNLRRRRLPIESRNRLITLHFATFPAFKFPERDHLHIKCAVAYCQGPCPQEPCDSVLNHFGSWREKYGRIADVLIDSTEVVNSVEVIAPDLDDLSRGSSKSYERERDRSSMTSGSYSSLSSGNSLTPASQSEISGRQFSADPTSSYSSSSYSSSASSYASAASVAPSAAASAGHAMYAGSQPPSHQINPNGEMHGPIGNSVCVSPGTVILALVILGVVLVISATATLWFALKRSEAKKYRHIKHSPFQHAPQPYYRFSHW